MRFYQVTPTYPAVSRFGEPNVIKTIGSPFGWSRGILITYVLAYRNDKGDTYLG